MALIRHCDMCNKALEVNALYIKLSYETDKEEVGIVAGVPLNLEGEYCSVICLEASIKRLFSRG